MANPAFVQQTQGTQTTVGSNVTAVFGSNTTTGNAIIVITDIETVTPSSITSVSDGTNTYTRIFTSYGTAFSSKTLEVWQSLNITGGTTPTITVTNPTTTAAANVSVVEVSGLDNSQPVDIVMLSRKLGTTGGTQLGIGIPELKTANEFILVYGNGGTNTGTWTISSNLSNQQSQNNATNGTMTNASIVVSSPTALDFFVKSSQNANVNGIVIALANITMPPVSSPYLINNFQFPKVSDNGNGTMSVTEKIR